MGFTFHTGVLRCEYKALGTSPFISVLKVITRKLINTEFQFLLQTSSNLPIYALSVF